jgi:hypothetical protein
MPPEWVAYVTTIETILAPILLSIFAFVGWKIRNRRERQETLTINSGITGSHYSNWVTIP